MSRQTFNVVLMGLPTSGKTSFFERATNTEYTYSPSYHPTFGIEYKLLEYHSHCLKIFDTPSDSYQKELAVRSLWEINVLKQHNFLDSPQPPTIVLWFVDPLHVEDSIVYINAHAKHLNSSICSLWHCLVVSKIDKVDRHDIKRKQVAISSQLHMQSMFHCSAKTGEGVEELLKSIHVDFYEMRFPLTLKKMMMLGPTASGKTALLERQVWNRFSEGKKSVSGDRRFYMTLNNQQTPDALYCLDFLGDCINGNMFNIYSHEASAVLFCVNVSSKESIDDAITYLIRLRFHPQFLHKKTLFDVPMYMVFTHSDQLLDSSLDSDRLMEDIIKAVDNPDAICKVMSINRDEIRVVEEADSSKRQVQVEKSDFIGLVPITSWQPLANLGFDKVSFVTSAKEGTNIEEMFSALHTKHFKPNFSLHAETIRTYSLAPKKASSVGKLFNLASHLSTSSTESDEKNKQCLESSSKLF